MSDLEELFEMRILCSIYIKVLEENMRHKMAEAANPRAVTLPRHQISSSSVGGINRPCFFDGGNP